MKKIILLAISALALAVGAAEPISSGEIVPGEWNSNYRKAYQYALDHNMPFITIISKYPTQCHFCALFHDKWTSDEFLAWAKERGPIMGAFYDNGPYAHDQSWCDWARGSYTGYPFVRIYWKKSDGTVVSDIFMGRVSSVGDADGDGIKGTQADFIARLEKSLVGWNSAPEYAGGVFADGTDTEKDRLEIESATTNVTINLTRSANAADIVATNILSVTYPAKMSPMSTKSVTASKTGDTQIIWEAGVTNITVGLTVDASSLSAGDSIELILADQDKVGHATNHIWYVDGGASASNPYWIGEKEDLGYGEWTMDLDAATNLVAKADGQANTIVLLSGSLWCPDCTHVDGFLATTNAAGENVFAEWAKSNNVALVMIDCPRFTNETDYVRSTLLSRKDIASRGVSGLGYMTRKMITDEEGAEIIERNRVLCVKNTSEGGFHRPEDGNPYRTGVPNFVVLRKDGTVAARLTRWASSSSTATDSANYPAFYNRFNELLAMAAESGDHADADEIENGYPGAGAVSFQANGGEASGELSHSDFRDVFKLDGVGGNALQKVTVSGTSTAEVKVSFLTTNALGVAETVGDPVTASLSYGASLEYTFTEARDYFVLVEGASITADDWKVENQAADNFIPYKISGDVVLVPQETSATATSAESTIVIRLVKGSFYRFQGLDPTAVGESLQANGESNQFFTALVDGDVELKTLYGKGTTVTYQLWNPGSVGFTSASATVKESAGTVTVPFARSEGMSGEVTVTVSLDAEKTAHADSDGTLRYEEFDPVSVTWKDGEISSTNVVVTLIDDTRYDGDGTIVLNLAVTDDENGDTVVTNGTFTITVTEDDKAAPGIVTFVESGTIYCKTTAGATVHAVRDIASDGDVTVTVGTTAGTLSASELSWANHVSKPVGVTLTGLSAGKTATLTLKAGDGGVTVPSSGRTLRVKAVADDAPEFDETSCYFEMARYVAVSNLVAVNTQTFDPGSTLSFTKVSGTLPAGLKASWDGESALAITGVPTKAGYYEAVYQVSATSGGTKVPGLVTTVSFMIVDPAEEGGSEGGPLNESVAKTRTFKDIMIVDAEAKTLAGLLQVTIPANGRASAKYVSADAKVSLSSKSWTGCDSESGALSTTLTGTTKATADWSLALTANADGSVEMTLTGPDGEIGGASIDGSGWSKDNPAEAYEGYYTVSLPVEGTNGDLAPSGVGYLTIKLQGASALKTGKAQWAGMLPNGTAISGSTILTDRDEAALLPIFKVSSKEAVSGVAAIKPNAAELKEEEVYQVVSASTEVPFLSWVHSEAEETGASFEVAMGIYGALYGKDENLETCCVELYGQSGTNMIFSTEITNATSTVTVAANTFKVVKSGNALSATVNFNRNTGILSGSFKYGQKTLQWKGVVLIGLGGCGECGLQDKITLPFVNGLAYWTERVTYETTGTTGKAVKRAISLKKGVWANIDIATEE